ncbi:MAG: tRNA pseudouridine(13) synthase TruD [Gammaproteobacteria bacterium]|nr:tRNA pseudouridine(13) synthase TruD [Gammaproteobacteria bacterium]
MENLPRGFPNPTNKALYRQLPEHFQVNETLSFKPSGEGDHLYLYIEKRNTNTDWLARELAQKAGIRSVEVGYAGRKDRFAVTRQWFSLHLPASKTIDPMIFQSRDYFVIEHSRHTHKLRKGEIAFNQFKLQLTEFEGDFLSFKKRLKLISEKGFPNYFGPQRFGHQSGNIDKARDMLSGKVRVRDRNKRSIYLSAARSYLFNLILAKRIKNNCWLQPIQGDIFWNEENQSLSEPALITKLSENILIEKLNNRQLSITGPMPGDGQNNVVDNALALESQVLVEQQSLYDGIANSRIQWQRRALRVIPTDVSCKENEFGVEISFSLRTGIFATSLLKELLA